MPQKTLSDAQGLKRQLISGRSSLRQGIEVQPEDVYLAPLYRGQIEDEALLEAIRDRQPRQVGK